MWNWKQLLFKEKVLILKKRWKIFWLWRVIETDKDLSRKIENQNSFKSLWNGYATRKTKKTQQIKHKNLLIHRNQNFLLITSFWNMNKTFSRLTKFLLTMKSFTVVLIIHVNLYWKFYVRRNGNGGTWLFQNYLKITGFMTVNCEKTFSNSCSKPSKK